MSLLATAAPSELDLPRSGPWTKRLLAGSRLGGAEPLVHHVSRLGGDITDWTGRAGPEQLLERLRRSGLRGRGGGGFPTSEKLAAVRRHGPGSVVVVNGSETEPAAGKDDLLLRLRPHLVLDGLLATIRILGARQAFLVAPSAPAVAAVETALRERQDVPLRVEVVRGPANFVGGEESALIRWLEGGPALPRYQPPRVVDRGWRGLPTLVQNVETLAHLGLVLRLGPEWFRGEGVSEEPGTMLVTLSGAVEAPGVYEVPIGTPLPQILQVAGADPGAVALLVGGYFGSWLRPPQVQGLSLSRASLRPAGATPGAGVLHLLPRGTCGLRESGRILAWLAAQGARQCGPCALGLPAMASALNEAANSGSEAALAQLHRWGDQIEGRGACRHPDGAVNLARSAAMAFPDELQRHRAGTCVGRRHSTLPLPLPPGAPPQ
ncbi:MAG: NADH-ubiquinone oxidoreductase-F iron-sulfur binding region domain-containing protein [Candidatus Dormibacteria bacterium]